LLKTHKSEIPTSVQLFGSEPQHFAQVVQLPIIQNFDIIDINMGCPMPKITKNGDGSALLAYPKKAAEIVAACVKATKKPVTVKVRVGINEIDVKKSIEFCKGLENAGASAITIHGRTAKQLYSGKASWETIGEISDKLSVTTIGNGDVESQKDAKQKMKEYGLDGIMIGRGAIGNPLIFSEKPNTISKKQLLLRHLSYGQEFFSERYVVASMRKHFVYYFKGLDGVKELKANLMKVERLEEVQGLLL
ncbi:MAG: tRNA-dihydrouridine synthase family protein, partial [Firmicutes bacterium]|nr:tRNA-dihydrouridine synthase family protein [Bacillota bacterium]